MFKDNLLHLRKLKKMSQEDLAERLGVSRQTLSKWETGESVPDIEKSKLLAEILGVSLDDLVSYSEAENRIPIGPKGKHIYGVVKVGEKGQIVIPAKAREIHDIKAGDNLIVLGDEEQGIAIVKEDFFTQMIENIKKMTGEG